MIRSSSAPTTSSASSDPTSHEHRSREGGASSRSIALRLLCAALAMTLGACVTKGSYEELAAERDQLQGQLASASEELESTRSELAAAESVNQDLQTQIEAKEVALAATAATYGALTEDLREELLAGQVVIEQLREGIRVQLSEDVLFDSGSADLGEHGRTILESVSNQLAKVPYRVEVEGHTDSMPIGGRLAQRYETNWDLAAARAAHVVQLLQQSGVEGDRLVAVSYGDTQPIASNDDAEGRAQNRRIDIRLIPVDADAPAVASPPPEE